MKFTKVFDLKFAQDPEGSYPACFKLLRFSPNSNHLGYVQNHAFCVPYAANWHILPPEDVSDFKMDFAMQKNDDGIPAFLIYFRGDKNGKKALFLRRFQTALEFGALDDTEYHVLGRAEIPVPAGWIYSLTVEKGEVMFLQNGKKAAEFSLPPDVPRKGIIALDTHNLPEASGKPDTAVSPFPCLRSSRRKWLRFPFL